MKFKVLLAWMFLMVYGSVNAAEIIFENYNKYAKNFTLSVVKVNSSCDDVVEIMATHYFKSTKESKAFQLEQLQKGDKFCFQTDSSTYYIGWGAGPYPITEDNAYCEFAFSEAQNKEHYISHSAGRPTDHGCD